MFVATITKNLKTHKHLLNGFVQILPKPVYTLFKFLEQHYVIWFLGARAANSIAIYYHNKPLKEVSQALTAPAAFLISTHVQNPIAAKFVHGFLISLNVFNPNTKNIISSTDKALQFSIKKSLKYVMPHFDIGISDPSNTLPSIVTDLLFYRENITCSKSIQNILKSDFRDSLAHATQDVEIEGFFFFMANLLFFPSIDQEFEFYTLKELKISPSIQYRGSIALPVFEFFFDPLPEQNEQALAVSAYHDSKNDYFKSTGIPNIANILYPTMIVLPLYSSDSEKPKSISALCLLNQAFDIFTSEESLPGSSSDAKP